MILILLFLSCNVWTGYDVEALKVCKEACAPNGVATFSVDPGACVCNVRMTP